jgi:hypothetical protein
MPNKKQNLKMPRRSISAYMHFSRDLRSRIEDENPGVDFGQYLHRRLRCCYHGHITRFYTGTIADILLAEWNELNDEERKARLLPLSHSHSPSPHSQPYIEKAAEDKEREKNERDVYQVLSFS